MFTVALIGPDGAGKTTVGRKLLANLPIPVKYLYMGVNSDSSNHVLPTTALFRALKRACGVKPDVGGPPELKSPAQPRGFLRRTARGAKSMLSLANRLSEEWYRQLLAWVYQWRGYVVLYDRHYYVDYFAYDIAPCNWDRPLARRIHGYMLERVYPKPDLVIYLDAPSHVLFARKGEGTIETLERRRGEYLELRHHVPNFALVDANRPADEVVSDAMTAIIHFHESRCARAENRAAPRQLSVASATSRERAS